MNAKKKRLIDELSFRTRNLPDEILTLWNAQLILTCYDPYVRFSKLPDDIIVLINKWLKRSILCGVRPAGFHDEMFQPLSHRFSRVLRLKTWAEFSQMPKDWIEGIDDNMNPFVSTYKDPESLRVTHRVARFRIRNDDFCAFDRVYRMLKAGINLYADFSNRIRIVREHSFVYAPKNGIIDPHHEPPVQHKCTMLYVMIGVTPDYKYGTSPWAWKQLREQSAKDLAGWQHDHSYAKRVSRQLYDIVMLAKRPKNC